MTNALLKIAGALRPSANQDQLMVFTATSLNWILSTFCARNRF